ncbi:hypothetical protein ACB496_15255 [Lelliottia nimipressuralis]
MSYCRSRLTASPALSDAPAASPYSLSEYPVIRALVPETVNRLHA